MRNTERRCEQRGEFAVICTEVSFEARGEKVTAERMGVLIAGNRASRMFGVGKK